MALLSANVCDTPQAVDGYEVDGVVVNSVAVRRACDGNAQYTRDRVPKAVVAAEQAGLPLSLEIMVIEPATAA
jgi:hypothetical protein